MPKLIHYPSSAGYYDLLPFPTLYYGQSSTAVWFGSKPFWFEDVSTPGQVANVLLSGMFQDAPDFTLQKKCITEPLIVLIAHPNSVPYPLVAGVITETGHTHTTINLSATDAAGGVPPYTYQWARRLTGIGMYVNVPGATSLTLADTGLVPATGYDYQLTYTDSTGTTAVTYLLNVTTDGVSVTTCSGTQEAGVCTTINISEGTGVTITGPWVNRERASWGMIVHAQATGPFNLDYLMSPDGGNTWYVGQQVAATVVTVDGDGETSYTYEAEIAFTVGFRFRIDLYNTGASEINGVYEWRYTSTGLRGFGGG